ncbi:MAG: hypothetical protein A2Y21_05660 [Clostridiales bacterium GWC2_40_7]|nr:MAG: hypothetical protein A2Y21_05660 [Clostridiales bacterium GWC2_40_7]
MQFVLGIIYIAFKIIFKYYNIFVAIYQVGVYNRLSGICYNIFGSGWVPVGPSDFKSVVGW